MASPVDLPETNDNRSYDYSTTPVEERDEYAIIARMVASNSSVIDLGCGNGSLLVKLQKEKNTSGSGIEISEGGVEICRQKGLHVLRQSIDERLPFDDNAFDYAVCNVTIQMVMYPEMLLGEMKRIARRQIVSFPNFAFYKNRIDMLLHGRMPRHMLFGYQWYSTGHIHQLSVSDFLDLTHTVGGLSVKAHETVQIPSRIKRDLIRRYPNLFELLPVFLLEKVS
jgi:methionine biosynthesis protein MetW